MRARESTLALTLATLAFAISFAVWGMLAPLAPAFQTLLHIDENQKWLMIAIPVLLGSVMRLPMGMLADRFGGDAGKREVARKLLAEVPFADNARELAWKAYKASSVHEALRQEYDAKNVSTADSRS